MRRVTPEGRTQPGECYVTPWGELRELVAVGSAGECIEAAVEKEIREYKETPNFKRDSIAGLCVMFGSTSGREKRDQDRLRLKRAKARARYGEIDKGDVA